jgi:hypothetical protein
MEVKVKIPFVPIIFFVFSYFAASIFVLIYLFNELKSIQNINLELANDLRNLQISLAELKVQSVVEPSVINTSSDFNSEIYRDLLKYAVYAIAILIFLLTSYYGTSYFFSQYVEVNSVFILLKKANSFLTGLVAPDALLKEELTSYIITDEATNAVIKIVMKSEVGFSPGFYIKFPDWEQFKNLNGFISFIEHEVMKNNFPATEAADILSNLVSEGLF